MRAWLIAFTLTSISCAGASPFVGGWKLDRSRSTYTDVMTVQRGDGGKYSFAFEGGPRETIVVDGTDQDAMPGTTLAVIADAPERWNVIRKHDRHVMITAMWTLSADGNSLSDDFTQLAPDGEVTVHATYAYTRTAAGSGFAGTWEGQLAMDALPATTFQIRPYDADGLSFVHPAQDLTSSFKLDGRDYPLAGRGAASGATWAVRRVGANTLDVVDKRAGTVTKTERLELSADHHTLTQTAHPVDQHGANVFVFERCATVSCS